MSTWYPTPPTSMMTSPGTLRASVPRICAITWQYGAGGGRSFWRRLLARGVLEIVAPPQDLGPSLTHLRQAALIRTAMGVAERSRQGIGRISAYLAAQAKQRRHHFLNLLFG